MVVDAVAWPALLVCIVKKQHDAFNVHSFSSEHDLAVLADATLTCDLSTRPGG